MQWNSAAIKVNPKCKTLLLAQEKSSTREDIARLDEKRFDDILQDLPNLNIITLHEVIVKDVIKAARNDVAKPTAVEKQNCSSTVSLIPICILYFILFANSESKMKLDKVTECDNYNMFVAYQTSAAMRRVIEMKESGNTEFVVLQAENSSSL